VNLITEKKMKRKFISVVSILIVTVLSACGPAPTPTLSAVEVQGTAVAQAWLAMTLTQLAMPTATQTPIPPSPTATFTPFPTLAIPTLAPPTLPVATAVNPCNDVPPVKPLGDVVRILFINKTDSRLNFGFGMVQANSLKECGTYNFTLGKFDQPEVTVLAGCYWGYGWVESPASTPQTANNLCVTDKSKVYQIWITKDLIAFH
jgi:hypothetical protein